MLTKPLVSVHIITFNQINFIDETLKSALEQDYENLEVVVSDDGSTDGTAEVILKFAEKYPGRLIPIVGGPNLGITGNSNRALKKCSGKYIAFQGGDDVLYPGKISKQVEWMEFSNRRVISGHDVEVFDSKTRKMLGIKSQMMPNRAGVGAEDIIKFGVASFYSGTSIMVRKSAIPNYGFDERIPTVSDWKFTIDCLANGGEYGCIDGIYAGYRKHGGSITDLHMDVIFKECIITLGLLEAQYSNYLTACKEIRSKVFYKTGNYFLKKGDKSTGMRYLWASASVSPLIHGLWRYPLFLLIAYLPISMLDRVRNIYRFIKYRIVKQTAYY